MRVKSFSVQMLSHSVSSAWWKQIVLHFAHAGDELEIRCWKEETEEIAAACRYGTAAQEGCEAAIRGTVTEELLEIWRTEAPEDKTLYNKMTKFFTIHIKNDACDLWSEHYGTEMTLTVFSDSGAEFFERVMRKYPEDFSIASL